MVIFIMMMIISWGASAKLHGVARDGDGDDDDDDDDDDNDEGG